MKKVYFNNSKEQKIAGVLHLPEKQTDSIVIIAHGFCANKDRERFLKISKAYNKENIACLRFDFGGSGESYETEIMVENQIDDLKSAIEFVKSQGYKDIGIQGESLGGLVSILVYNFEIKTMVLLAPITKSMTKLKEIFEQEKLSKKEMEEKGYIVKLKDNKEFKIPRVYFEERLKVNQKKMLSRIKCPVLILHSNEDDCVLIEDSKEAIAFLPKGSRLEVIKGGSHSLSNKVDEVIELAVNWFKVNLK